MITCDFCGKWMCKVCAKIENDEELVEVEEMTETRGVKWFCSSCEEKLEKTKNKVNDDEEENEIEKGKIASLNWMIESKEKDLIEKSKLIEENEKELIMIRQLRKDEEVKTGIYENRIRELEDSIDVLKKEEKLILIKDADTEIEGRINDQNERIKTLTKEKIEMENERTANIEKIKNLETMVKTKTLEMEVREKNLQEDWNRLVEDHNIGVEELKKKKEQMRIEEETIMYQRLDVKRQLDIYKVKDLELIKSQDTINKLKSKTEKQEAELIKIKKENLEASKGYWSTQEVEAAIADKEKRIEATRDLLDQRDKEIINLKVNMGESLTKIKEIKRRLDEKINREDELTKEKIKLEDDLKKLENEMKNEDKEIKKSLDKFSKRNAILEQEAEEAKKFKHRARDADKELSLIQEKYTEICKESQKGKKEKEKSDIEVLKLKK